MLQPGSLLKERYSIERHLGKGGMGSVYLATDQTFSSRVALKETIVHGDHAPSGTVTRPVGLEL